jgi:hypothetical protein
MTVKTSISLTDEQETYARSLVERERYSSLNSCRLRRATCWPISMTALFGAKRRSTWR